MYPGGNSTGAGGGVPGNDPKDEECPTRAFKSRRQNGVGNGGRCEWRGSPTGQEGRQKVQDKRPLRFRTREV